MDEQQSAFAKLRGGRKRRRSGASMRNIGGGQWARSNDAEWSMAYRFPKETATPKQLKALDKIMVDYLRIDTAKRFPDLSIELVGKLFNLGERQAQTVVSDARNLKGSADLDLVIRVLHSMLSGEVAGILGTPKSKDVRSFFRRIHEFDFQRYKGKWPESICIERWLPLPADAVIAERFDFWTARIKHEDGREYDVIIYEDDDGSLCYPDRECPSDFDLLRMLHAAFRVEYREWLRENR